MRRRLATTGADPATCISAVDLCRRYCCDRRSLIQRAAEAGVAGVKIGNRWQFALADIDAIDAACEARAGAVPSPAPLPAPPRSAVAAIKASKSRRRKLAFVRARKTSK